MPPAFDAHIMGVLVRIRFRTQKLEWCDYLSEKKVS